MLAAGDVAVTLWAHAEFRHLVLLTTAAFTGYFVLLSVAPLWAVAGGAGESGAGLVTGALLLTTIVTQPAVPWLLGRFGPGATLTGGLVALGAPSPLYALSSDLAPLLAVSAVRGVGFGILTVSGSSLVAVLSPADRRGEGIGVYGLAAAIPQLFFLPLGVLMADTVGFAWVFVLGAAPLLGVPAALGLGRAGHHHFRRRQDGTSRRRRSVLAAVAGPTILLTAVTMAGGGLVTFVPIAFDSAALASSALLVLGGVAALSRWRIGRLADAYGAGRLMWPSTLISTIGLAGAVLAVHYAAWQLLLVPAMLAFGIGYGAVQNLTLVAAFSRAGPNHFGVASAAWNIGFDAGTAVGAILLGGVAESAGFTAAFALSTLVVALCLPVALAAKRR